MADYSVGYQADVKDIVDGRSAVLEGVGTVGAVYADSEGRLWRVAGSSADSMVCIFDPRQMSHAVDAGQADLYEGGA